MTTGSGSWRDNDGNVHSLALEAVAPGIDGQIVVLPYTTVGKATGAGAVGDQATVISAADVAHQARIVQNTGPLDVWVGHTAGVTATGATKGVWLRSGGSGVYVCGASYRGDIYAVTQEGDTSEVVVLAV